MTPDLRALTEKWRAQVAEGDAWVPGQPMNLSADELGRLSLCLDELEAALASRGDGGPDLRLWQPIATAPKDEVLWFWVRPKTSEEAYTDTSGNSIFRAGQPRIFEGKYNTWSALETADWWMRIPWPLPPAQEPSV